MNSNTLIIIIIIGLVTYLFLNKSEKSNKFESISNENEQESEDEEDELENEDEGDEEEVESQEKNKNEPTEDIGESEWMSNAHQCTSLLVHTGEKLIRIRHRTNTNYMYLSHSQDGTLTWTFDIENSTVWRLQQCANDLSFLLLPEDKEGIVWCEQSIFTARNCFTNAKDDPEAVCKGDGALSVIQLVSDQEGCFLKFKNEQHGPALIAEPSESEGARANITNHGQFTRPATLELQLQN